MKEHAGGLRCIKPLVAVFVETMLSSVRCKLIFNSNHIANTGTLHSYDYDAMMASVTDD